MLFKDLFRTKPVQKILEEAHAEDHSTGLKRELDAWHLIALGIGGIIGTGIFVMTGTVAALHAGPSIILSFLISAVGCGFAGLCYAEFAAMIPISGSAYTYSYATVGELIAWIMGWDLIIEYLFASSTVAAGWSGYFVSMMKDIGLEIPENLAHSTFIYNDSGWHFSGALFNLPAVMIVILVSTVLYIGIKESAKFNNWIVFLKLAVIMLFILFGGFYVKSENWFPFIPENTGKFGEYGWSGVMAGAGMIFFAYIGFDAVSTAAQEAKNPKRDLPIGIVGSLLICTILYIAVALVLTGIVHYSHLNVPAPIAMAIDYTGDALLWLKPLIKIGAIAGLSSVILVMLMAQPRIFLAMANDGLLPPLFKRIHPKYQTPHVNTIICGVFVAIVAGLVPINQLGELVSIGTLLAFVLVCLSILILRHTRPDLPRPFKTPGLPWVPLAGAGICLAQMYSLPWETWLRLIVWLVLGLAVYFFYGMRKSVLNKN